MLAPFENDFEAAGLAARLSLDASGNGDEGSQLTKAFADWDSGDHDAALEALGDELAAETDADRKDLIRRVMVAIFTELGASDPVAAKHRRRLATLLN